MQRAIRERSIVSELAEAVEAGANVGLVRLVPRLADACDQEPPGRYREQREQLPQLLLCAGRESRHGNVDSAHGFPDCRALGGGCFRKRAGEQHGHNRAENRLRVGVECADGRVSRRRMGPAHPARRHKGGGT